jgi:hypothetical protein
MMDRKRFEKIAQSISFNSPQYSKEQMTFSLSFVLFLYKGTGGEEDAL